MANLTLLFMTRPLLGSGETAPSDWSAPQLKRQAAVVGSHQSPIRRNSLWRQLLRVKRPAELARGELRHAIHRVVRAADHHCAASCCARCTAQDSGDLL